MKEMESKGVEKEFLAGSNRRKESQSPKKGRHEAYELPRTGHFWLFFQTSRSSYAQSSYKTVHWQAQFSLEDGAIFGSQSLFEKQVAGRARLLPSHLGHTEVAVNAARQEPRPTAFLFWVVCLFLLAAAFPARAEAPPIPVIYGTDLFHPHEDPDDHFDLATLLALPELEVKAILLDQGGRQLKSPGSIPLRQMLRLSGRTIPFAIGLRDKLASASDDGRAQPAEFQGAVDLLLKVLREASEPVTIITAGSVRDVCAAWNRDPSLLQKKVGRLYLNIGTADDGGSEYNVDLDAKAYTGLLRSGMPIYLCFCLPMRREGSNAVYSTWWRFRQADVLEAAPRALQNYFIYALQRPGPEEVDPLKALEMDLRPWRRLVWGMDRNMWCTAPFLHAAGRTLSRSNETWTAMRPPSPGLEPESLFTFVPARIEVDDAGKTKKLFNVPNPNVQLFKVLAPDKYGEALRDCLRELFRTSP